MNKDAIVLEMVRLRRTPLAHCDRGFVLADKNLEGVERLVATITLHFELAGDIIEIQRILPSESILHPLVVEHLARDHLRNADHKPWLQSVGIHVPKIAGALSVILPADLFQTGS
jgi:hypothetical protein